MNVKEIVVKYLKDNGYDGLYHCDAGCACHKADLMPHIELCGECAECESGYIVPCPPDCGEHEFHIVAKKLEEPPCK